MPLVYDFREDRVIKKGGHRRVKAEPKGKQATLEA